MDPQQLVWYAAYGSNLLPERFSSYLGGSPAGSAFGAHRPAPDSTPPRRSRRSTLRHPMFFAGWSVRWSGPVAFVELTPVVDAEFPCRLYLVSIAQLMHLACAENQVESVRFDGIDSLEPGAWADLSIDPDGVPTRAKYNALLRLPDVDDVPVFTLTTARALTRGEAPAAYVDTIRRGLTSLGLSDDQARAVLAAALRSTTSSSPHGRVAD